jgi:hypothetical protein
MNISATAKPFAFCRYFLGCFPAAYRELFDEKIQGGKCHEISALKVLSHEIFTGCFGLNRFI